MKSYILTVLFLFSSLMAETKDKTVAKVGKVDIPTSEFVSRFEMTPWNKAIRTIPIEKSKRDFLFTLIAEKLYAQKAVELGYDTSAAVKKNFRSIEKLYVKDALYRQEIQSKVKITDMDLKKAYYKAHNRLHGDFLMSSGEKEIRDLYKTLQSGVSFDTLVALREKGNIRDTLGVHLGKFDEELENTLYALKPGGYTQPVLFMGTWYIIRIKSIRPITPANAKAEDAIIKEAKSILENREISKYYNLFANKFFKNKKADVNGKAFALISFRLISSIQQKIKQRPAYDTSNIYMSAGDFIGLKKELGSDTLKLDLVKFEKQNSTISDFLDYLHYDENAYNTGDEKVLKQRLNNKLKRFMESELLAAEGYKRGLHLTQDVKSDVQMWKDNYLFNALLNTFLDSLKVTEQEVKDHFNKLQNHSCPAEVNIVEVLTDRLEVVEKVLEESNKGADMKELAKKYSIREMTRQSSGEFGFFPVTSHGEIGRIASTMNVGEIFGPLKVPEGYSVFKLIGRKEGGKMQDKPFEAIKDEMKQSLSGLKRYHGTINYTVKLAKEYGIKIDENVLTQARVTNIFTVMYRYLGFGGRLLATPMMNQNTDWVEQWQKEQMKLP